MSVRQLRFPDIPGVRPSWRRWWSQSPKLCRGCGRMIGSGWRAMGVNLDNPYLCRTCWKDGVAIELTNQ